MQTQNPISKIEVRTARHSTPDLSIVPKRPLAVFRVGGLVRCIGALVLFIAALLPQSVRAQPLGENLRQEPVAAPSAPAWLEPRGLSIVDMVGEVPEDHLRGSIIRYWPGVGVALYESGQRVGNTVTIRAKMISQYPNLVMCLGKPGDRDEWLVAVPASTMRIFDNGVDVTRQLVKDFAYFPAGFILPNAPSTGQRYPEYGGQVQYNAAGEVIVPANSGCWYWLQNPGSNVVAEFKFQTPRTISVEVLGSQNFTFQSYIGPGYAGLLASLQDQMDDRFSRRHQDLKFTPPAGMNYIMMRQPLTPVDPYGKNPYYPGGGTYRIRSAGGRLSVDHINTMAIPFYGQWRDADQSGGSGYLPFFDDPATLTAPEYFVPTGIAYDPCMTNGGCSSALLNAIHDQVMTLTVYFYRITPIGTGLTAMPLRQVGPGWDGNIHAFLQKPGEGAGGADAPRPGGADAEPGALDAPEAPVTLDAPEASVALDAPEASVTLDAPEAQPEWRYRTYLPAISRPSAQPVIDTSLCPCGIFTSDGRMVGYIPR